MDYDSVIGDALCRYEDPEAALDELTREPKPGKIKHGARVGGRRSPEYMSWFSMIQRCRNPKNSRYASYGGRGITVCERWKDFRKFLADMGKRPVNTSLDRFPNKDGDYEPGNCRWATPKEQRNNSRDNRIIAWRGEEKTLTEWAKVLGMGWNALRSRLDRGWSIDRAITEKIHVEQIRTRKERCVLCSALLGDDSVLCSDGVNEDVRVCAACAPEK